ncbi:hypothetical protein Sango_1998900 [Sesamum angolense]|uniref:Uncharacterized protein n=1 Tax=Sesamum angolense TaxID=2727404 RepID=A0AAE2BNR8_9LAMI|nr:hypothetical protein Sango_1998900 [Sesamum angolense]
MHGGGRASQMVDLIDLQQNRLDNIMSNQLEPGIPKQMHHILLPPGEKVINDDDIIPSGDQLIDQMTTDEAGTTGNNDPLPFTPNTDGDSPHPTGISIIIIYTKRIVKIVAKGVVGSGKSIQGMVVVVSGNVGGAGIGGREDGEGGLDDEESGADQNADEDEEKALLLEDVSEGSGEGSGWFKGFGGVGGGEGRFFVLAEDVGLFVQLLHGRRRGESESERGLGRIGGVEKEEEEEEEEVWGQCAMACE